MSTIASNWLVEEPQPDTYRVLTYIFNLKQSNQNDDPTSNNIELVIQEVSMNCKLDTGFTENMMSINDLVKLQASVRRITYTVS